MSSCIRLLMLTLSLLAFASASQAVTITVNATDSGHHTSTGSHSASNESYSVGWSNEEVRNFFVFDLSLVPFGETILGATLRAYNPADDEPDASYDGGYRSGDATETYELFEVTLSSPAVTQTTVGTGSPTAVFNDLGDGASFGTQTASVLDNGQDIDVVLNAAGIAHLQTRAGIGDAVLGGVLNSLASQFNFEESIWVGTDPQDANPGSPYTRQLILTVTPEPGTGMLLALGLLGMAARRRHHV